MATLTDFNVSPYYDDYADNSNYHRVLFRPSYAIQARELTQAQTILQNQIERFGSNIFKEGAMIVPGNISLHTEYAAVKLTSFSGTSSLSNLVGGTFTGATSGVQAVVIDTVVTDGNDSAASTATEDSVVSTATDIPESPVDNQSGGAPDCFLKGGKKPLQCISSSSALSSSDSDLTESVSSISSSDCSDEFSDMGSRQNHGVRGRSGHRRCREYGKKGLQPVFRTATKV